MTVQEGMELVVDRRGDEVEEDDPTGQIRPRPRFGATKLVFMAAVSNYFAFEPTRKIEVSHEHIARIEVAIAWISVALQPPSIVVAIATVLVGLGASRVGAGTAAKLAGVVIPVARSNLGLPPVAIAVVVVGAAPASTMPVNGDAVVVTGAEVTRVKIQHAALH